MPPRAAAFDGENGDPIELALAEGVRAIGDAMRRAPPEALEGLAERMAIVVGELAARREGRGVDLDERRRGG